MKKKTAVFVFAILTSMLLAGCSPYVSSYKALMLITTDYSDSASMSFSSFEGTNVFSMKAKEDGAVLAYTGEVEGSGSATVYYDDDGTKKELFKIAAGEKTVDSIPLAGAGKVYVIVETDGKCEDGAFFFDIKE
ncbi:MAG: hypothetical protein K5697_09980 [Lachnospiraceae bacterium]|jgi:hypothetical protein|nr:hypothetical protein [Lachnospiraceae bacterium]